MATLRCIVFFLACAFLLQEIQTQRSNYHSVESSSSSSFSQSSKQDYKKEVKYVNNKSNAVMMNACGVMRSLNLDCSLGGMNRRFMSHFAINAVKSIANMKIRMLYALVYLCEKIIKCITMVIKHIVNALISALPPCTQKRLRAIKNLFKIALRLITQSLRTIYNFAKDVAKCALALGECIKNIFDKVFQTVINIIRNLVAKVTETAAKVFRLSKGCPVPPPESNPDSIMIRFGKCVFCAFKPSARMCG